MINEEKRQQILEDYLFTDSTELRGHALKMYMDATGHNEEYAKGVFQCLDSAIKKCEIIDKEVAVAMEDLYNGER